MVEEWLANHSWVAVLIWVVVYVSDYYLTIYGMRLFTENGKAHFDFGGSYELNPNFEEDVNNQRLYSRRFVRMLALTTLALLALWASLAEFFHLPEIFLLISGFLIFMEVPIQFTHLNNITLFSKGNSEFIQGKLSQPRWLTLQRSAINVLGFFGLFVLLFVLTGSLFILGGALGCARLGIGLWIRSSKERKKLAKS